MRKLALVLLAGLLAQYAAAQGPAETWSAPADSFALEAEAAPRWQVGAEFIFWWLREGRLPPTLTTSSPASQGLLGQPDTQIIYGDDRLETRHGNQFNGGRVSFAYWLDTERTFALEADAFFLERDSTYFKSISDGTRLLARPYFLPDGTPASFIIAGPGPGGLLSGAFVGYSRVELFGEEVNLAASLYRGDTFQLDGLLGARFLQMRDRVDLTAASHLLPDQTTLLGLEDHYRTHNTYYGAQAGLRGEWMSGPWSVGVCGTIGLGGDNEQIGAFGDQIFHTPLVRVVTPTGLAVQASNTGNFDRTALNMVSEVRVQAGYRLTECCRIFAGYTFLLWDGPVRAGDQIDLVINPNAGTAPARPTIPFREDVFWAQGLNVGLELRW